MPVALSDERVAAALGRLPGWTYERHALRKRFVFGSFPEAISFITRIAFEAERMEHHPEIHNVYGTVDITLITHDAGNRVSQLDVDLAQRIEAIAWV